MPKRTGSDTARTSSADGLAIEATSPETGRRLDEREQTTRNLRLIRDVVERELVDEFNLDRQPKGVRLILLPMDDPELAHANLDAALALANRGEDVQIQLVPPRVVAREASASAS